METACRITVSIEDFTSQGLQPDLLAKISVLGKSKTVDFPFACEEILSLRLPSDEWLTVDLMEGERCLSSSFIELSHLMSGSSVSKWVNISSSPSSSSSLSFSSMYEKKLSGKFLLKASFQDLSGLEPSHCMRCSCLQRIATDCSKNFEEVRSCEAIVKSMASQLKNPIDNPDMSGIEVQSLLERSGPLSGQEAQHLRSVIVGLNDKVKSFSALQVKLTEAFKTVKIHREAREAMHKALTESSQELKERNKRQEEVTAQVDKERNWAIQALKEQHNKWQEKCLEEEALRSKNLHLQSLVENLQKQASQAEDLLKYSDDLRKQIRELDDQRSKLKSNFEEINKKNEEEARALVENNTNLENEIISLREELKKKNDEIHEHKGTIEKLDSENHQKEATISSLKSDIAAKDSMIQHQTEIENSLKSFYESQKENNLAFASQAEAFSKALDSAKENNSNLHAKNVKLFEDYNALDKTCSEQKQSLISSQNSIENLRNELTKLEIICESQKDASGLIERIREISLNTSQIRESVYDELDKITSYMSDVTNHMVSTSKLNSQLKEAIEERDGENTLLREMVADLKRKINIYVPVKDDPIDVAVADYSNTNFPEVPFVREAHGVYIFGAKRVFVKLENGRVNIRVGGGFMKIEDFVQFYSPAEVERYENKLRDEADTKRASMLGQITKSIGKTKFNTFYAISPVKNKRRTPKKTPAKM